MHHVCVHVSPHLKIQILETFFKKLREKAQTAQNNQLVLIFWITFRYY